MSALPLLLGLPLGYLLYGKGSEGCLTWFTAFVRFDPQLEMGDSFSCYGPVFALEGGTGRAEGVLLAAQFAVNLPAVTGDQQVQFLRAADIPFFDFQGDPVKSLCGIKGEKNDLLTGRGRDPATAARPALGIEHVVDRVVCRLRGHKDSSQGSDIQLSW